MNDSIDHTHDAAARSWLESANLPTCDFPIQNLPFCVFETADAGPRGGIGLGDCIIDLAALFRSARFEGEALFAAQAGAEPTLNALMALSPSATRALRHAVFDIFNAGGAHDLRGREQAQQLLLKQSEVTFQMPCRIGGYTDFLTSRHHTERNGRFKGLTDPLPPAFMSLPVAYNGRTSSMRVSGTEVVRPRGQYRSGDGSIVFAPSAALDFELEMGLFVRGRNPLGTSVRLPEAETRMFGLTLFNDWSAKDIQWWEQVLGPFLGKSFLTSLSPWVVTMEALAPFRGPLASRAAQDPPTLPYLDSPVNALQGAFDIRMDAFISSPKMRETRLAPKHLTRTNLNSLYWTFAQMLTHHTSNGCNLEPGDFLGSGTVSGAELSTAACMTEIAQAGKAPVDIGAGETRAWLQDGDTVTFRARAERAGYASIGFGECTGTVASPA